MQRPAQRRWCLNKAVAPLGSAVFAASLFAQAPQVFGKEWESSFDVSPEVIFSDNVCLNESDPQSEWIGSLTPELRFRGGGQRVSVDFAGSLQFHTLDNNNTECVDEGLRERNGSRADSPIPNLLFSSRAEVFEDWLFVNATANARQNAINQFQAGGNDGLNRTGNFNTTTQYGLNPFLLRRIGSLAALRVGYDYSEQRNTADQIGDNTQQGVDAAITSIGNGSPLSWSLSAYATEVEFEANAFFPEDSSELRGASLQLSYQLGRQWQLNGSVGEEDNEFPTLLLPDVGLPPDEDTDGSLWDVGFVFTPNERVAVAAGYGERFFGSTPRFDIRYQHKRSVLLATYSRDLNFSRDLRSSGAVDSQLITLNDDGIYELDNALGGFATPTTQARSPIINERFTLGYNFKGRRHIIDVQASQSIQRRTDIADESEFNLASITLTRILGRSSEVFLRLHWDERLADDRREVQVANNSETWWASAGYEKNLSQRVSISVAYQYIERDSELLGDSFEENRVTAGFNVAF